MASEGLSRGGIFRQGKRGFVVCGQISNLVGASNKTIGNLYAVNSGVSVRQPCRNCRAPQHRLRVRRQQLDIVSAQCHQAVTFSCDFELDPARMDLLNLSDGIFREFVHNQTWIAGARIALQGRTYPRVAETLTSSVRKLGGIQLSRKVQADFFGSKQNSISFPFCCLGVHAGTFRKFLGI